MDTQAYISSGVIEAYVMGIATEEEIQILECVQKHNTEIRQAVINAQKAIERLVTNQAVIPPAHLKKNIWAAIQAEETKEIAPVEQEQHIKKEKTNALQPIQNQFKTKSLYKGIAIAASISLLLSFGALIYFYQRQENFQNTIAELKQKNNMEKNSYAQLFKKWSISINPEIKTVILAGVKKHPDAKAIVYMDKSTKQTYLSIEKLPACPTGYVYQLWAIIDGKPVDAGMYRPSKNAVQKMHIIDNAQAFAITLEKQGGSKTPTVEQMYVVGEV